MSNQLKDDGSGSPSWQPSPPPTPIVHPATQATISVSAVVVALLWILQATGVLTPTQAANVKQVSDKITPTIQQYIDQEFAARTPPQTGGQPPANQPPKVDPKPIDVVNLIQTVANDISAVKSEVQVIHGLFNQPNVGTQKPVVAQPTVRTQIAISAVVGGKSITSIDSGRQFSVISTGSEKVQSWGVELLTVDSSGVIKSQEWDGTTNYDSADVTAFPDGSGFAITLRSGSVGIVGSGMESGIVKQSKIRVSCNQAAQPPPVVDNHPNVGPQPNVQPTVVPGSRHFTLYIVEDPTIKRSVTTASILNNLSARKTLVDRGHTITSTISTAADAGATFLKSHPASLPALVVVDNANQQFVQSAPLPTDMGLSIINGLGG